MMFNKRSKLFHSSVEKQPLVRMSASWFLVSTYLISIPGVLKACDRDTFAASTEAPRQTLERTWRASRGTVSNAVMQRDADSLGHSCRLVSSRYWVAQGREIMRLQVFAGWGSQVILRYISDAPLESAVCFNRQQPTSSHTVSESKSQADG